MPHPAEIARTLTAGRLPGVAQVPFHASPYRVRHATDHEGRPMLLCREGGQLDDALRPRVGEGDDTAVVLAVGESRGARVWVSGWATALEGIEARAAALEFAAVNPVSDLLDVDRGFRLYRMDVAEVRLECPTGHLTEIDVEDYAAAEPAASVA
ncbi:hypothetical protein ACFQZ4_14155 [Catellatospora coxensis]|uniref:Uncharacterized protein n=1 Tax=Catellatospora coxensis TaxID=310354 RepID=A0A8J3PDY4_9ACTN|nr:hypothetical protein [Catellatospora coxensis]GIG11576.1 hypothetical protein Cco03nite_82760 [Catellatospora coxensis]